MSALTITHVDTHRIDLRRYGRLVGYAICDRYGWSLMQHLGGVWVQVDRLDESPALTLRDRAVRRLADLGAETWAS